MANCNAIKIRDTKTYKTPKASNLAHNSAMTKATYWLNNGDDLIQSHSYQNHNILNENWNQWISDAKQRYTNNHKRALRSDAVIMEEGLIVIGTDVQASTDDIVHIVKDFIQQFEEENNTKVRHWSYHNHEGYIDENNKSEKINRHVHFLFDNVSNDGVMIRRAWKKNYFEKLQDTIFNISKKYIVDIQRAKKSEYKEVEIEGRIVKVNTKLHIHHRRWREQKKLETISTQNNQTLIHLAKQKDLKDEMKILRAELQKNQAKREDYARLEQLNKELKEHINNKDLSIDELKKTILKQKLIITKQEDEKLILEQNIEYYEDENKVLSEQNNKHEEIFTQLDKILITQEDQVMGKEYLKGIEIVERVKNLDKENSWFRARFLELNQMLRTPMKNFKEIFEVIKSKLEKSFIDKLVAKTKEVNKEMNTFLTSQDEIRQVKTPPLNSQETEKHKPKKNPFKKNKR